MHCDVLTCKLLEAGLSFCPWPSLMKKFSQEVSGQIASNCRTFGDHLQGAMH